MSDMGKIPNGQLCMLADWSEAFASFKCPFLQRENGGSGSIGCIGGSGPEISSCRGVILCPMRTYRCAQYPDYELAVRKTARSTEILKCPECNRLQGLD